MKKIRKTGFLLLALALLLTMSACGGAAPVPEENSPVIPEETAAVPEEAITVPAESPTLQAESPAAGCYTQISQALAKAMTWATQQASFDGKAVSEKVHQMASPEVIGRQLSDLFTDILASA